MSFEDKIKELNYKYQFVKNNKYWNYNKDYELKLSGQIIKINENDVLLDISNDILRNVKTSFGEEKSMREYKLLDLDEEKMKKIVVDFYMSVDSILSNKIAFILSKISFIEYDESKPSVQQRSVTTLDGITIYYKKDLKSLVDLAHEISHCISNLDDSNAIKDGKDVEVLSEVEAMLTEELFLNYLKNNHLIVKDSSGKVREIDDSDINNIKQGKYRSTIQTSYRVLDEINIKKLLQSNDINDINFTTLDRISRILHIPIDQCLSRIEMFIDCYYPSDEQLHDFVGKKDYDLKNGRHLSNEARFIFANCLIEKFNNMNLDMNQKIDFYKRYLVTAKDMSFQNVLQFFNVDLTNLYTFSQEFVDCCNSFNIEENKKIKCSL